MTALPRVLALMTTYNGEEYLREQVESVLAQEGVRVTLRVRDDCSADGTWVLLQELSAQHSNIEIARNELNVGCVRNFMGLLYEADASSYDFVAFCDQDDVWYANKLAVAAQRLDATSARPQLYYAGINNVDASGVSFGNEYAPYQVCAENYASLLLVQNWCLGCTTLMNPALVRLLQEHQVYDFGRMYDAWVHAVALYCGGEVVCDLQHAYIDRRITGSNTVGVMNHKRSASFIVKKALRWLASKDEATAQKHTAMARCLLEEYGQRMDAKTRRLVEDVALREESPAARRRLAARSDVRMTTGLRTCWLRVMLRLNRF